MSLFKIITKPPFPIPGPSGGPLIPILIEGAKKLWDIVTNSEYGKGISQKDKFDEDNISNVIDYNKLLNDFTKEIEEYLSNIEERIIDECTSYYKELILLVETIEQRKNINLHSRFIKRSIENFKKDSSGNLARGVHRLISLDNIELKKILSLPAGELKKNRVESFKQNLIKQVLNDFIDDVRLSIEDISTDVSDELNNVISDIRKNNEILLGELSLLEKSKDKDEESIKVFIKKAETKVLLSDEILSIMGE